MEKDRTPISAISIYFKFHCIGTECPHSCCKGWQIAVDEDTYQRYKSTPGAYGRSLRFLVYRWKGGRYIRKLLNRCPHWNSDRKCQFQVNGETELMPRICRLYPRDIRKSDVEVEITLELSCISAARLFLDNPGRLSFLPVEEDVESLWVLDNNEPEFYEFLKRDRERILDYLWEDGRELSVCWQSLYAYVYKRHDLVVKELFDEADEVFISDDPDEMGMYYLNKEPSYAFYPIKIIDRMILNQIDYGNLKRREKEFYRLIESYKNRFSDFYVDEADSFFDENIRKMMSEGYEIKYRSYFSYCIQQLYLRAYETYYMLREFLFSVLYTELLMVFDLVDYLDRGRVLADKKRQSEILMLCEQGIRHNNQLSLNLLQIIRDEFL